MLYMLSLNLTKQQSLTNNRPDKYSKLLMRSQEYKSILYQYISCKDHPVDSIESSSTCTLKLLSI